MDHQLAGHGARRGEPHTEDNVVHALLEHAQELFAGLALHLRGAVEVDAELPLEQAVDALDLLLLAQLDAVFGELGAALAVLAGGRLAPLDCALVLEAALALEIQLDAFAAAELADGEGMTGHENSLLAGPDGPRAPGAVCGGSWDFRR